MRNIPTKTAMLLLVEQPDPRLVQLAQECGGTIVTDDADLRPSVEAQGVPVMNLSELAIALRPKVRRGDQIRVKIVKPGQNANEGVAYLDDDTMVVVERGQHHVGATLTVEVTGVLQTVAGRMAFARPK